MKNTPGPKPKNIQGVRFDRLLVSEYLSGGKWRCICDCGTPSVAHGADLRRGKVRSCGCLQVEAAKKGARRTHGAAHTPEYRSWVSMIRRCTDSSCSYYHRYGGRGITVCEQWLLSFETFLRDMGSRPKGTTIDRKENNGNYEPDNCRWATPAEQAANTSTAVLVTANGKTQPKEAWARELGVSSQAIGYRLKQGLSHEEAINKPFRSHRMW
jgi:hypothetical protein